MHDGRYARSSGVLFVLCPRSLKIELLKGYVGGLDASAFNRLHIGLLGNWRKSATDDGVESFTVCGFLVVSMTMST
jgi:hypothetical protein